MTTLHKLQFMIAATNCIKFLDHASCKLENDCSSMHVLVTWHGMVHFLEYFTGSEINNIFIKVLKLKTELIAL